MRYLLLAILLTGCGCSTAPILADAQQQIDHIKADYLAAALTEDAYDARPNCPAIPVCADGTISTSARRANYTAGASIVSADQERTAAAMAKARKDTDAFVAKVGDLK